MIYFDNSATTRPIPEVIEAIRSNLSSEELFGNPGSLHELGTEAMKAYNEQLKRIAAVLHCYENELYFTSCATESANTAILGYLSRNRRNGNVVISTKTEHKATLETLKRAEELGFTIKYVEVNKDGKPNLQMLEELIDDSVTLMCFTHVNNETGSILPLDEIVALRNKKNRRIAIYLDMVQSVGKLAIDLKKMGIEMGSFSGHKIHSVKGIGLLYVKAGVNINPYIVGGGQQNNMRSGTQSLVLAEAMRVALEEAYKNMDESHESVSEINQYLRNELIKREAVILSPDDALDYVLNVSFKGFESETMLHCLEKYKIYVSTVSACSSKSKKVSYVLLEMKVDRKIAGNSIRLSFSRYNTMEEAQEFIRAVDEIYKLFALH